MSKLISISSLVNRYGEQLDQSGLTEERLENMVLNGEIQGQEDHLTGELMIDRQSICDFIQATNPVVQIEIEDGDDDLENYFKDDYRGFF